MTISFSTIPVQMRTPGTYVEFDSSKAVSGLPAAPTKVLLVGQRLGVGQVKDLIPTRITSPNQAAVAFGRGSMLHRMAMFYKGADAYTELWAVAVDADAGAAAAQYTITSSGDAAASGTVHLMIAGQAVEVPVVAGDTAAQVASKIATAIAASRDVPFGATVAGGVITLTFYHAGTQGNLCDIRFNYYQGQSTPTGVKLAVSLSVPGTGIPDITQLWAAIGDTQYTSMILGFVDNATLLAVQSELASRWAPPRMIEGMAYAALRGTLGALAGQGDNYNSPFISILGMRGPLNPPWEVAAAYGAVVTFNGSVDPARPFQTLALPGILAPASVDLLQRSEREILLLDGISTYVVRGGVVQIERAITTYELDATGMPDVAWLDVNTPLTLSYLRYAVRDRIASKYPRHKLADDDANYGSGQAVVTPKILRAELVALFRELEEAALVEDLDQFIADLQVERDATDKNRVNALIPPNIVNQFRVFAGRVEFRL